MKTRIFGQIPTTAVNTTRKRAWQEEREKEKNTMVEESEDLVLFVDLQSFRTAVKKVKIVNIVANIRTIYEL